MTYFPDRILGGNHTFFADWYGKHLKALREPSLWRAVQDGETYAFRFLYLRTFDAPLAIRVDFSEAQAVAVVKVTDGSGGYEPGRITQNERHPLTAKQKESFLAAVDRLDFWRLPTLDTDYSGLDGAQWVVEGVELDRYHLIDRWSPQEGVVRKLGLLFFDLANLCVDPIY